MAKQMHLVVVLRTVKRKESVHSAREGIELISQILSLTSVIVVLVSLT